MKKNRYIPFGYAMENGQIISHPQEAPAVRMVFQHYLHGDSLAGIAKTLDAQGPVYNEGKRWNKHMIKRILEDRRYLGETEYPLLVSPEDYTLANRSKAERNTSTPIPVTPSVASLRAKTVCADCGSPFLRRPTGRWYCKGQDCKGHSPVTDSWLLDMAAAQINRIIQNPTLLRPAGPTLMAANLEVTRLQNDISRELDRIQIDEGAVRRLLFSCATAKYTSIPEEVASLQTEFSGRQPLTELNVILFSRTVERLLIAKDGTIALQMIDRTMLPHYDCDTQTRSA